MFVPLHIHTGYTFLKSSILIEKLLEVAQNSKISALGISDIGVMYGYPKFFKECQKHEVTPLFGMDIVVDGNALSLYIQNEKGYVNLIYISSLYQKQKEFTFEQLKNKTDGLKCVIRTKNPIFFDGIDSTLPRKLSKYSSLFKEFYIGIEIYTKEEIPEANLIREFANHYSYTVVAFPLISYLKKEDAIAIKILDAIDRQTSFDFNENIADSHYFFKNQEEVKKFYYPSEIDDTELVLKNIEFVFNKKRGALLHYEPGESSDDLLIKKLHEGLKIRGIDLNKKTVYRNRLNQEYLTIKKMGYSDYFLIVQDYVLYAKNNNIPVGPGRGSAAGSLVSYLLQITEVDPIKYNLLFERFLNDQRETMPDIDIDFSDTKRDYLFSYLNKKYGERRCARVVTFQTFGAKQSLRDVTKAYGFPNHIADKICKTIPNSFLANNYDLDYAYDNIPALKDTIDSTGDFQIIFDKAHLIEGLPRQKGLHAAGMIIDNNDLLSAIPLTYEEGIGQITQFEKDYLEDQGFLKMDLLGLSNLRTIENCLENIKKYRNKTIKINDIPYTDPKIFELILSGSTMGLFQLDTAAATQALNYIKPTKFEEVVATISLDRPGPQKQIPSYARRKEGLEKIDYIDKSLEPILKETYGIIVYQEQIMQICMTFAGFSSKEADLFRIAISKKHQDQMIKLKDKFVLGAQKNGHNIKIINQIYNLILKFAEYGFNKSHALSYAIIACQEAYLKAYYGPEFYLAILDQQYGSNDTKFNKYISEIQKNNIEVLLPDINKSSNRFLLEKNNALRMPLLGIKEFPNKIILNILNERSKNGLFNDFLDFVVRMYQTEDKITETQLSKLIDAGCFDNLCPNRKSLKKSIPHALQFASTSIYKDGELFADFGLDFKYVECEDDPFERMENEMKVLGVLLSDSLLKHVNLNKSIQQKITPISSLKLNKTAYILVIIKSIKDIKIKTGKDKGKPMAFLTLTDEKDELEATLFVNEYAKYQEILKTNRPYLLKGVYSSYNDKKSFTIDHMKLME